MIELIIEHVVKLLSAYMFITLIGISLGVLLLNFSSPEKYEPFILISLLLSLASNSYFAYKT